MTSFSYSDAAYDIRKKVSTWIKEKYSEILGDKIKLLDHPQGLEMIQRYVKQRMMELKNKKA